MDTTSTSTNQNAEATPTIVGSGINPVMSTVPVVVINSDSDGLHISVLEIILFSSGGILTVIVFNAMLALISKFKRPRGRFLQPQHDSFELRRIYDLSRTRTSTASTYI